MTNDIQPLPAAPISAPPLIKPARVWPLWLGLLITLLLIAGLAFWYWQDRQLQSGWQPQIQTLQQNNQQLMQQVDTLQRALNTLQSDQSQAQRLQSDTDQRQTRQIDHNALTLAQVGGNSRTDWLLAEAEYLLRLANQRLTMERDAKGAEAILKAADKVLAESDDPGLYTIRQMLANELLSLQNLMSVDREGIFLRLDSLINMLDTLEQQAFLREPVEGGENLFASALVPEISDTPLWKELWSELKQLIVIRRLDTPAEPLLPPEQSHYLKLNLRMMLEQAELALLEKNQTRYQHSLAQAQRWLSQYFSEQSPQTQSMQNLLQELSTQSIAPELPDISGSLKLLKDRVALLYRQHQLPVPGEVASAPEAPKPVQQGHAQ